MWETAMRVCPHGWHLPENEEWEVLTTLLGGEKTAGKYLKATNGWKENGNGEDKFGFSALPGGNGYHLNGEFSIVGFGRWWTASKYSSSLAVGRGMYYNSEKADWFYNEKDDLFSVRCIQN